MLTSLFFGVALPLWFASIYGDILATSCLFTFFTVIIGLGTILGYLFGEIQGNIYDDFLSSKLGKVVIVLLVCNAAFSFLAPNEKFMRYTMYGIAGYNATVTLAETPLGKKTIQVASNGTNKVINATGQMFDSTLSNTVGLSGLLNVWIEKKSKSMQLEMQKDIVATDSLLGKAK